MKAYSVRIDRIEDLIEVGERIGGCVFRGHGSEEWTLESTLERAAAQWRVERTGLHERERILLSSFQRRAHHYVSDLPQDSDLLEWTSLLQHYGGPTRLLDVTRSYLVATFFAVERADDDGVVWAFKQGPLTIEGEPEGRPISPASPILKEANEVLAGGQKPGVRLIEPFRMNRRLTAQQGAFLMPLSIERPFVDQLSHTMKYNPCDFNEISLSEINKLTSAHVCRIIIPKERHSEIMRFLSRSNITAATLFEGLEGFSRSLHTIMRIFD